MSQALDSERVIYTLDGDMEQLVGLWRAQLDTYGICPLRGQQSPHPKMIEGDMPCLHESCALWSRHRKCCGVKTP